jgi:hypothetical protein
VLLVKKLLAVLHGDLLGTAEFMDQETGGHLAEFFKTSQERLDKGIGEDINGAVLEMARKVDHSATQLRIVIEILDQLVGDKAAMDLLDAKWDAAEGAGERSPRPDLRDVIVGATSIAPAYASTTGPLRRLYIEALRGSYAPTIYTFGLGPELLDALIAARILPIDIAFLEGIEKNKTVTLSLVSHGAELESYERLASGDFVEMMQSSKGGTFATFITHRTQATTSEIKVRQTTKGSRLLAMLKAGRGEG